MERQLGRAQSYRAIAPRHDLQGTQKPVSPAPEESKAKRASMACLECKKRRIRVCGVTAIPLDVLLFLHEKIPR
jgi:hypothetical protein